MDTFLNGISKSWQKESPTAEELQAFRDHPEWVKANRLETLLGSVADDWKENYVQNWGRVKTHLQVFGPLSHAAERVGLKWLGYRGPFAGVAMTGDAAMNYFADLDILVSENDLDASLALFQAHGFSFRSTDLPQSFYRKHHLHYSLHHEATGVLCDLHWAVDHPYTHLAVDYHDILRNASHREQDGMAWWEPSAEHRYILSALHAMKHFEGNPPADLAQAVETGGLRFLLEGLCLMNADADIGHRAEVIARDWNAQPAIHGFNNLCRACRAVAPRRPKPCRQSSGQSSRQRMGEGPSEKAAGLMMVVNSISSRHGFRLSRVRELGGYLWPTTLRGQPTNLTDRLSWALKGGARLLYAAADYSLCTCQLRLKALGAFFFLAMIMTLPSSSLAVCEDDYPGGRESATLLSGVSNSVAGAIEHDIDRDWFCFNAYPGATYQFEFDTNTIWDVDATIHAPDGSTVLLTTNSVTQAPAVWGWTNNGAFGRYYVELGGFVEFTTGTYSMVVVRSGFADSDGDGLDDAWETNHFSNLDITNGGTNDFDGDGFTDEVEYYLTTQPTNAASGLFVIDLDEAGGFPEVTWPSVVNGSYRISRSEELNGVQTWVEIQTLYETNTVGLATVPDSEPLSAASNRFYRIEFLY